MPRKLYGAQELRERLGVSRTRVLQLIARPDFPALYERLAGGAVWLAEDVEPAETVIALRCLHPGPGCAAHLLDR
jgi:prophage regulatory protein